MAEHTTGPRLAVVLGAAARLDPAYYGATGPQRVVIAVTVEPAASYVDAVARCRQFISRHGVDASSWWAAGGGALLQDWRQIGNVGFDGRVWDLQGVEIDPYRVN